MNKQAAAEFLGVSIRALERYTQQGKLSVRYQAGKTRPVAVYDDKELKELKQELQSSLYPQRPSVKKEKLANTAHSLASLSSKADLPELAAGAGALVKALKALSPAARSSVAVEHKLLLNLSEAQALTGLSRAHLRDAIEAGKLKAQIIGKAWRIKRADLERYIQKL